MIGTLRHRALGLVVVLALVCAGLVSAFAYSLPSNEDLKLDAYALAGGDVGGLCGDPHDHGKARECSLCHLVAASGFPDPVLVTIEAELSFVARVVAPRESRAVRSPRDPALGLRAPPAVV